MKLKRCLSLFLALIFSLTCFPFISADADGLEDGQIIADGIYIIQNIYSDYYLQVSDDCVGELSYVCHMDMNSIDCESPNSIYGQLSYMWKIKYLGEGKYSLRPLHKLDFALTVINEDWSPDPIGYADEISDIDSLTTVPNSCQWTIELDEIGYVFKQNGLDVSTLFAPNMNRSTHPYVVSSNYEAEVANCHWQFYRVNDEDIVPGVILYNTEDSTFYSNYQIKKILIGQTKTLEDLGFDAVSYSSDNISQEFVWSTTSPSFTVNSQTGAVTCHSAGSGYIVGTSIATGLSVSYRIETKKAFTMGHENMGGYYVEDDMILSINSHNNWQLCGYNSVFERNFASDLLYFGFEESDLVFIFGHGSQHQISLQNKVFISDATVERASNSMPVYDFNFSNIELCIYNSCEAAKISSSSNTNVCKATIASGVKCVVGWAQIIHWNDCILWQERFQNCLLNGYTVNDAVIYANSFMYENGSLPTYANMKSSRIYGDKDLIISASNRITISDPYFIDFTEGNCPPIYFDQNNYKAYIREYFGNEYPEQHTWLKTYTSEDLDDFVFDVIYDIKDTAGKTLGYSIIVEDNVIVAMRDNSQSTTTYTSNESEVQTVTSASLAEQLSLQKLHSMSDTYTLHEQYTEFVQTTDEYVCYYRVFTSYTTPNGEFGSFYDLYRYIPGGA